MHVRSPSKREQIPLLRGSSTWFDESKSVTTEARYSPMSEGGGEVSFPISSMRSTILKEGAEGEHRVVRVLYRCV